VKTALKKIDLSVLKRMVDWAGRRKGRVSREALEDALFDLIESEGREEIASTLAQDHVLTDYDQIEQLEELFSKAEAEKAWDQACLAGEIKYPMAVPVAPDHSWSIEEGGFLRETETIWMPCEEACEYIFDNAVEAAKLKNVRMEWVERVDPNDPLPRYVRYSLDGGSSWVANKRWKMSNAIELVLVGLRSKDRQLLMKNLRESAVNYAKPILSDYSKWANGELYELVVGVFDRSTGKIDPDVRMKDASSSEMMRPKRNFNLCCFRKL
jgi:hypothetical protein